jgi:tetratricopeptide (TPR) repeat protein
MPLKIWMNKMTFRKDQSMRNARSHAKRLRPTGKGALALLLAVGALILSPVAALADEVGAVQDQLAEAVTRSRLGELADARRLAEAAFDEAEALDWAPLVTKARFTRAQIASSQGEHDRSESELRRVYLDARRQDLRYISLDAALRLAFVVGRHQLRPGEGMLWAELASAEFAEIDSPGPLVEARLVQAHARMFELRGDFREALTRYRRASRLLARAVGQTHPRYADAINNLALAHAKRDELVEARDLFERSLEINERTYGPEHPRSGKTLENLGFALLGLGEVEQATLVLQRNLRVNVGAFGWDHVITAQAILTLGALRDELGDLPEARTQYKLAIGIMESLGTVPPVILARAHNHLGEVLLKEPSLSSLADAGAAFSRALALTEEAEDGSVARFFPLEGLARVEYFLGRHDAALRFCERALAVSVVSGERVLPPTLVANVGFLKARVLVDMGDRALARRVAEEVRDTLEVLGPEAAGLLAEVEAWLDGADVLRGVGR